MSRQNGDQEQSYFAEQRDILVQEIGLVSMSSLHQNCDALTHCSRAWNKFCRTSTNSTAVSKASQPYVTPF